MHYNISSTKYSVLPVNGEGEVKPLFVKKGDHTLMNEFGIYVLDELHQFGDGQPNNDKDSTSEDSETESSDEEGSSG